MVSTRSCAVAFWASHAGSVNRRSRAGPSNCSSGTGVTSASRSPRASIRTGPSPIPDTAGAVAPFVVTPYTYTPSPVGPLVPGGDAAWSFPSLAAGPAQRKSWTRLARTSRPPVPFCRGRTGRAVKRQRESKDWCRYGSCCERFWEDLRAPLRDDVGYLSIYSRSDGVVRWRSCLDEGAEHREVHASHIGMAVSAQVYGAIAAKLAELRARAAQRVPLRGALTNAA